MFVFLVDVGEWLSVLGFGLSLFVACSVRHRVVLLVIVFVVPDVPRVVFLVARSLVVRSGSY